MIETRQVAFHRNGAYGEPYWTVQLWTDEDWHRTFEPRLLVAVVFPEIFNGIAVIDPAALPDAAEESHPYRGAHYWETAIRAIDDVRVSNGSPPYFPALTGHTAV